MSRGELVEGIGAGEEREGDAAEPGFIGPFTEGRGDAGEGVDIGDGEVVQGVEGEVCKVGELASDSGVSITYTC